jgi:hypothetical protein
VEPPPLILELITDASHNPEKNLEIGFPKQEDKMHHPNKANLCHHDELDAKADNKDTDTRMAKMRRTGASEAPSFVMTGYKVFSLRKMDCTTLAQMSAQAE